MLFRLFKKKKPIAIETTPTGSEPLANDYIPDQNEIRAAALVKRFGFDFDNLPHDTIRELLQEELSHPQEGSFSKGRLSNPLAQRHPPFDFHSTFMSFHPRS